MKEQGLQTELHLIPYPQVVRIREGICVLRSFTHIGVSSGIEDADGFSIQMIEKAIFEQDHRDREEFTAGLGTCEDVTLIHEPLKCSHSVEAYRLEVTSKRIRIVAGSPQGRFYAVQTLRQLILGHNGKIPCLVIEDWPDLPHRGVMIDISRGKVPTLETLKELAEFFAYLKYNQLQLYVEHTFAFKNHPLLGEGHSPLQAEDIVELDSHCRHYHIALVPNLQSFGHATQILKHPCYAHMAESDFRGGWTLSPAVPDTYQFLDELYAEYLPLFSHRPYFNINCDETRDLGKGKSVGMAQEIGGVGQLFLRHIEHLQKMLTPYGCRPIFWGDFLEKHPDLAKMIPRDVVLLNWHYQAHGAEKEYETLARLAQAAGVEHWVCPGVSTRPAILSRNWNAQMNLREWARVASCTGASGYLVTDWGDEGHLSCISNSYWGFAYGADCAWRANPDKAAEERFNERFLSIVLPGAPREWLHAFLILGSTYLRFEPSQGLPNYVDRAMLTGDLYLAQKNVPMIRFWLEGDLFLPSAQEILEAMSDIQEALRLLTADSVKKVAGMELIRREWSAAAALTLCAHRRGLAYRGHPKAESEKERKKQIEISLNMMEEVWMARNRPSDWAQIRQSINDNYPIRKEIHFD